MLPRLTYLILLFPMAALADVIFVPDDFPSLQLALNASSNGDSIVARSGIHFGPLTIPGWDITLASEYLLNHDEQFIAACIIQPDSAFPDTRCIDTDDMAGDTALFRLVGLTIRAGHLTMTNSQGGGIRMIDRRAFVENCRIKGCLAADGGGLYAEASRIQLIQTWFIGNDAMAVGRHAVFVRCSLNAVGCRFLATAYLIPPIQDNADISFRDSDVQFNGCLFQGLGQSEGQTTVFAIPDASVLPRFFLRTCTFQSNNISRLLSSGGQSGPRNFVMDSCTFLDNTVAFGLVDDAMNDSLQYAEITNNWFEGTRRPAGTSGAGLFSFSAALSYLVMERNFFFNNDGGAYSCLSVNGQRDPADFRIQRNYLTLNSNFNVTSPPGGAIFTSGVGPGIVEYNSLSENFGHAFDTWQSGGDGHALHNYWGDSTGPYVAVEHMEGRGDTTDTDTIYDEWLLDQSEIPDTSLFPSAVERPRPRLPETWSLSAVYPNPFNSRVSILLTGVTSRDFEIRLFDLLGRQVALLHSGRAIPGTLSFSMPPSLATGIYFLRASDHRRFQTAKLLYLK